MPRLTHELIAPEQGGTYALCVRKSRGKITIDELGDYLRYNTRLYGHWVIILNTNESTCDVGWPDDELKGDSIILYQVEQDAACPVCAQTTPPEYCPHCGEKIMEETQNG